MCLWPYSPQSQAGRTAASSSTRSSHMLQRDGKCCAIAQHSTAGRGELGQSRGQGGVTRGCFRTLEPSQQEQGRTLAGGEEKGSEARPPRGRDKEFPAPFTPSSLTWHSPCQHRVSLPRGGAARPEPLPGSEPPAKVSNKGWGWESRAPEPSIPFASCNSLSIGNCKQGLTSPARQWVQGG